MYIYINIYIYINVYIYICIYIICAWHYLRSTATWKELAMAGSVSTRTWRWRSMRPTGRCCMLSAVRGLP